jgi:hypothetical protein
MQNNHLIIRPILHQHQKHNYKLVEKISTIVNLYEFV